MEALPSNLRDWASTIHNRIGKASQDRLRALYDERARSMLAIQSRTGAAIPDVKSLNDAQIESLLCEIDDHPIELTGNPDFCDRIQSVADRLGIKVSNPHQLSDAERKAAELRYTAAQREELAQKNGASAQPVFAPK